MILNIKNNHRRNKSLINYRFLPIKSMILLSIIVIPLIFSFGIYLYTNNLAINSTSFSAQNPIPQASSLTADFNITITSLSKYSAYHGETVTITGTARRWNYPSGPWQNANGETICAVINGVLKPEYSTTVSGGNFNIVFTVPFDWDIFKDYRIEANVTSGNWIPMIWNASYLDVKAQCSIDADDSAVLPAMKYNSDPGYNVYQIVSKIKLDNNSLYKGPVITPTVDITGDGSGPFGVPTTDGNCIYNANWQQVLYSGYTWSFAGNANLSAPTSVSKSFKVMDSIIVDFLDTELVAYHGYQYQVRGRVAPDYDPSGRLPNIMVRVEVAGMSVDVMTNLNGIFTATFPTLSDTTPVGPYELSVLIIQYNGQVVNQGALINPYEDSVSIEVRAPTLFDSPGAISPGLIIVIVVIVGATVGLIVYMRWRINREHEAEKLKMMATLQDKLEYVRLLQKAGRVKESLGYLWLIYAQMASIYYEVEKGLSETPKAFAMKLVKEFGQNPASIYTFIQLVEQAIYGTTQVTEDYFNSLVNRFKELYLELTGKPIDFQI